MHRGLDCRLLLLWWIVTTLTLVLGWPINQPNAQPTEILGPASQHSLPALCNDSRCSCTSSHSASQHAGGLTHVNCQCTPQDQEATLDVYPSSVPRDVSLVAIRSCRSVIFHEGGIKHLNNLSIVTVEDAGEVLFHSGSFNQLKVETKTAVTIGRCRQLLIKTAAFVSHSLGPVALNSSHCHSVRIEESAFSRLSRLTLANIQFLHLASHAFRFTTVSPLDGDHIKTEILIEHVNMTELKSFTFPSPLDHLVFENVTISGQIHANATSALRIVRLSIFDSRIGWIAAGAFSEFTHLDWLEMLNTRVGHIDGRAFSSAASSVTIEGCQIGRMNQSALSMPVARVSLHSNHIDVLATGALNLREWNELLIENNTVTLIERHAFYNIGEPKLLPSPAYAAGAGRVRFIIRHNVFHQVQLGAFIISAEVPQLKLEENHFQHNCDCQMAGWAAQLTQITRRTETTTAESFLEEEEEDEHVSSAPRALWLGSSLFNSSLCRLDQAAAECLDLSDQPQFLSMKNYTDEFCPAAQDNEFSRCLAMKRSSIDISRIIDFKTDDDADDGSSGIKLVDFSSRQDLVMIIVLSALCVLVFLAVCLGLVVARFRTKTRQQQRSNKKIVSNEERVTCSPLIPSNNVEKQLGSGVVSSGSISRLSVKDYRNYLEDLGPIYSEPLEPPESNAWIKHVPPTDSAPPDVPAMPVQWTPKGGGKADDANKRTIDRGTQTLEDGTHKVSESENLSSTSVPNGEPLASSLALEFTQDVMAALRDKMDVSPLYSEVKDSIVSKELDNNEESAALTKGTSTITPDFYDLIKVVDQGAGSRPSTSSARSEHIYCKPWDDGDPSGSKNRLPSSVSDETPPPPPAGVELKVDKESAGGDALLLLPPPAKQKNNVPVAIKSQPFHVRGSLPKWPPPAIKTPSQNRSGSRTTNSSTCSPPTSPVKDAKPPSWQSSSRSIPAARKSPTKTRSEINNTSQKTTHQPTGKPNKESTVVQSNSSNVVISPTPLQQSKDEGDGEYAEVTPQPFSFSFRRPLFADRQNNTKEKSISAVEGPPKPARSPVAQLCEYADPRDLNEPLYSELIVQDEQQHQQHDNL